MISRSGTRRSGAASGEAKIFRDEGSGPVVTAGTVLSGLERMFMGSSLSSLMSLRVRQLRLSSPRRRGSSTPRRCGSSREAAAYWIARSSRAMTTGGVDGLGGEASCGLPGQAQPFPPPPIPGGLLGQAEPLPHPRIRVGILGDVGNDGDGICARGKDLRGVLELDAADRDQRDIADALLPFRYLRNALRLEAHRFERGEEDRTQRDIIGLGGERGVKLGIVMGGDAERQAGLADRSEVGVRKVLLAEMKIFRAGDDRRAPIVVHDQ